MNAGNALDYFAGSALLAVFLTFAQRAFCAAAILARAAALNARRRFDFGEAANEDVRGLPGPLLIVTGVVFDSSCLACSSRAISASISFRMLSTLTD